MPKEKGQGLLEYLLILMLAALVTIVGLIMIDSWSETTRFDQSFAANGNLIYNENIFVGTDFLSHPAATKPIEVPSGGDNLSKTPRSWRLSGCLEMRVMPKMTILHAAVPLAEETADLVNLVTIQMPIPGAQTINICGPEGVTLKIILWYE